MPFFGDIKAHIHASHTYEVEMDFNFNYELSVIRQETEKHQRRALKTLSV